MDTTTIRQQLHNYLEVADDKKVKAIYVMMEEEIKESAVLYTDEFKAELDKRYADYKSGKAKMITASESKKRIQKILKAARKK
jgi:putative addiction module component (TIGR02574 family)